MKQRYVEDFEVFNGLFIRTCHVVEFMPELASTVREVGASADPNSFAASYDLGGNCFALEPTYRINKKKFLAFVIELEAHVKSNPDSLNLDRQGPAMRKRKISQYHARQMELYEKYSEAFRAMIGDPIPTAESICLVPRFNLLLYPRSGGERVLFDRFVRVYLEMSGCYFVAKPGIHANVSYAQDIKDAYKRALPEAQKIIEDFKVYRAKCSSLAAAVKATQVKNKGLSRGLWKTITPYLKEGGRLAPGILARKLIAQWESRSERTIERYLYMR